MDHLAVPDPADPSASLLLNTGPGSEDDIEEVVFQTNEISNLGKVGPNGIFDVRIRRGGEIITYDSLIL